MWVLSMHQGSVNVNVSCVWSEIVCVCVKKNVQGLSLCYSVC